MDQAVYKRMFLEAPYAMAYCRLIFDKSKTAVSWEIIEANDSFHFLKEHSKDDLFDDNNSFWINLFSSVYNEKKEKEVEYNYNSQKKWFKISIVYLSKEKFYIIIHDITDQKKKELDFCNIIDNTSDVLWTTDLNLNTLFISSSVKQVCGFSAEEYKKINPKDRYPEESFSKIRSVLTEEFAAEKSNKTNKDRTRVVEIQEYRSDGSIIELAVHVKFLRDENGKVIGLQGSSRDITTQKELQQNLDKHKLFLDSINDLAYELDDKGNVIWVNKAAKFFTGMESEKLFGQPFLPLFKGKEQKSLSDAYKRTLKGETLDHTHTFKTGVICHFSSLPQYNYSGEIVGTFGIGKDITEILDVERAFKSSQEQYKMLVENSPVGIILADYQGNITRANPAALKILGSPSEEETKKINMLEFKPLIDVGITGKLKEAINKRTSVEDVIAYKSKWGKHVDLRFKFKPIGNKNNKAESVLIIIEDFTEQKNAEKEIIKAKERAEESEKRYESIYNSMHVGIFRSTPEGKLLWLNDAMVKIYGYNSQEELLEVKAQDIYEYTDDRKKMIDIIEKQDRLFNYETKEKKKDGTNIWVSTDYIAIKDKKGNLKYIEGIIIDVTKQKESELVLKQNNERLKVLLDLNLLVGEDITKIYDFTLKKSLEITNSKIGFLGFLDEEENYVNIDSWSSSVMEMCQVTEQKVEFKIDDCGIWGEAIRKRKPLIINDFKLDNSLKRGMPEGHVDVLNYLSIPVFDNDKIVAVIAVGNKEADYTRTDINELTVLMNGMWNIVKRKQYEQQIIKAKEKAEESEERYNGFISQISEGVYRFELKQPMSVDLPYEDQLDFLYKHAILEECNSAFINMYNHKDYKNIIGKTLLDFHGDKNRESTKAFIKGNYQVKNIMTEEVDSEGNLKYFINNTIGIVKNGKLLRMWGTQTDVTGQRKLEMDLRKAKEIAEENEVKFKAAFYTSPDSVTITTLDGQYVDVNEGYTELSGYTQEEVIGKNSSEIDIWARSEDREFIVEKLKEDGIVENKEVIFRKKNGGIIYCLVSAKIIRIKNESFILLLSKDISIRKKIQDELIYAKEKAEESEMRFKALHNASFGGIAIHDKGVILDCNQGLSEISGYPYSDLIGMDGLLLIAEAQRKYVRSQIQIGYEVPYETIGLRKNGEEYPVRLEARNIPYKGKKVRVVEFRDITQQKRYEQELYNAKGKAEKDEAKHSTMISNISDVIGVISADGIIKYKSPNIEKHFGWKPEDLINAEAWITVHPDDIEIVKEAFYSVLNTDKPVHIEYRYRCKNGKYKYVKLTAVNLIDNKIINGVLINYHDNTDYKRAEKDLITAKKKAEESDKLKTEFINNMSHEIRTPMNSILGFSSLLDNTLKSEEKRKHFIKLIQNSGKQLLRVVDDILEISRLGTKQVPFDEEKVNLNDLLLELFSYFDMKAKENKTPLYLKKGLSDNESIILTDKSKLHKILSNLLENALKFTFEGDIEFGYSYKPKSNFIELFVKDTGVGIDPNNHQLIFDRFSQENKELSSHVGGLGLGLSIAKENTELIGGEIWVESEKGKGSIFHIRIPYNAYEVKRVKTTQNKNAHTILIAEDEEVNFLYLDALFEEQFKDDYNVLIAKNGEEAVEMCKSNKNIDLVLMDIKMPNMNGMEATKEIRKFASELPIIAQTAYTSEEDKINAFKSGCNDFVSKPIDTNELQALLDKYLIRE